MRDYLPIEDHGVIGDMHTVALVGTDGTSTGSARRGSTHPACSRAILDTDKGGRFRIAPADGGCNDKQLYLPDTNVLITRFLTPDGVGEVQDFMPIHASPPSRQRLVRRVHVRPRRR